MDASSYHHYFNKLCSCRWDEVLPDQDSGVAVAWPTMRAAVLLVLLTCAVVLADPKPAAKSRPAGWKTRDDAGVQGVRAGRMGTSRKQDASEHFKTVRQDGKLGQGFSGSSGKVGWRPFSKSRWQGIKGNMSAAINPTKAGAKGKGLKPAPPGSYGAAGQGQRPGKAQKKGCKGKGQVEESGSKDEGRSVGRA